MRHGDGWLSLYQSASLHLQGPGDDNTMTSEMRSASLQPLIGKAAANGGPPKAMRLKPSRPPPPPPTAADLEGAAVSLTVFMPWLVYMPACVTLCHAITWRLNGP